ncbi:STAR3 protein, partial [Chloroceryle aenea]|nr:STAR3 protein [Chloroceryle aenea]
MSKPTDLERSLPAIASISTSFSQSQGFSPYCYFSPEKRKAISDVRRTFCLFVTFDLLFISLLWIIELNTKDGIQKNLETEIIKYKFKTSFFDIFVLAFFRFFVLLLAYAVVRLRHWWVIAVTTLVSSAFLIVKVILSELLTKGAFGYLLPIVSFVIAWLETWFLDFKVLTQEAEEERCWTLCLWLSVLRSGLRPFRRGLLVSHTRAGPWWSDNESDEEGAGRKALTAQAGRLLRPQSLPQTGAISFADVNTAFLFLSQDFGDVVYSFEIPFHGKTFILKAFLQCSAETVYQEVILQPEKMILWNRTVAACQVRGPDKDGLITGAPWSGELELPGPTPAVGGAQALLEPSWIRGAEALNLRRSSVRPERSALASCVPVPIQKPERGENGPGGFIVLKCPSNPRVCTFIWILNTDLK